MRAVGGAPDDESVPWILRRAAERRGELLASVGLPVASVPWSPPEAGEDQGSLDPADPPPAGYRRQAPALPTQYAATSTFTPVSTVDDELLARDLRFHAWAWLALGVVLITAFGVGASVVEGRAEELERTGARVPGLVVEFGERGEDAVFEPETVLVEFTWEDRRRRELVHLDDVGRQYHDGEAVTVLVDRENPDRASIPGESNQSPYTLFPMLVAFVGGVGALIVAGLHGAAGRKHRRQLNRDRREATGPPWRTTPRLPGLLCRGGPGWRPGSGWSWPGSAAWSSSRFGPRGWNGTEPRWPASSPTWPGRVRPTSEATRSSSSSRGTTTPGGR